VGVALAAILATGVVLAVVLVPRLLDAGDQTAMAGDAAGTEAPGGAGDDTSLDGVRTSSYQGGLHVAGEDVTYAETPPMGGTHDQYWLACGSYDEPVRDEHAVHSLEHGAVWITHDPALGDDEVDSLENALPEEGILSPREDLPGPVVVTVWNKQLVLTGADDARLDAFIDEYGDGGTSPEPFASCVGGVEVYE